MPRKEPFVPNPECMVASGDCFTLGKCLADCKKRDYWQHKQELRELQEHVAQLHSRIIKLEKNL